MAGSKTSGSFGLPIEHLLVLGAVVWHLLAVASPAWVTSFQQQRARDFATYYYAVQVGHAGGDPYDTRALNEAARADGVRSGVHPFLYAPPFLAAASWVLGFDLGGAYHLWFWLDELLAVAAGIALWLWWRPLGRSIGVVIAVVMALMTAIPNNHAMGQANFPGLLLAICGLWQTDSGRPRLGGALMGAACMLKMSPALFVFYWLLRREWTAVAASVAAGAALSVLALPFAGPAVQWGFYTHVLPTFSSGDYNGLAVSIRLFGNHSLPNLLDGIAPGDGRTLSVTAQWMASLSNVVLLGLLGWAFRRRSDDPFVLAAQASCVGVLLLLMPVYTYEHHIVFAIPAAVLAVAGVASGRLSPGWAIPVGLCVAALCFDLQVLKSLSEGMPPGLGLLGDGVRELKSASLIGLFAASGRMGYVASFSSESDPVPRGARETPSTPIAVGGMGTRS